MMNDDNVGYKHHYGYHLIDQMELFMCYLWRHSDETIENTITGWNHIKRRVANIKGVQNLKTGCKYIHE